MARKTDRTFWTEWEDWVLKRAYELDYPVKQIAIFLKRSEPAIMQRAAHNGLKRSDSYIWAVRQKAGRTGRMSQLTSHASRDCPSGS